MSVLREFIEKKIIRASSRLKMKCREEGIGTNGCVGETTLWRGLPRLTLGASWRTSRQSPTKSQLSCWQPAWFFRAFFDVFKLETAWNFSSQFSELGCHNKDKVRSKWVILSVAFLFFTTVFLQDKPAEIAWAKKRAAEIFSKLIQDLLVCSLLHSILQFCKYGSSMAVLQVWLKYGSFASKAQLKL